MANTQIEEWGEEGGIGCDRDCASVMECQIEPIAQRLRILVHVLKTSRPCDDVRRDLLVLIQDNYDAFKRLMEWR